MPVFPFGLVRLAGLPWSVLDLDIQELLMEEEDRDRHIFWQQELKEALSTFLFSVKEGTNNYPLKAKLTSHLQRLNQGKSPKSITGLLPHLSDEQIKELSTKIEKYQLARKDTEAQLSKLERLIAETESKGTLLYLERFSQSPLWADLPLINPGLAARADDLLAIPLPLNKKKRQTWRALLKVLTRSVAKTSPFAHFGPVAWTGVRDSGPRLHWQLNQWLHRLLREHLISSSEYEIKYQVTPSLQLQAEEYLLIQNELNKETIHRLGRQPLLELLINILSEQSLSLNGLQIQLLEKVEVEPDQLKGFMEQLIGLGFLQIDWPVKSDDPYWLQAWIEKLSGELKTQFSELLAIWDSLGDPAEEVSIALKQEQAIKIVQNIFPDLPKDKSISQQRIFSVNVFASKLEKKEVWQKQFEQITGTIQQLLDGLFPNAERASLALFYENHFSGLEPTLLAFHEQYHQAKPFDLKAIYETAEKQQNHFITQLRNEVGSTGEDFVILDNSLSNYLNNQPEAKVHPWRGVIIQKGTKESYLTHTFLGHGKMVSRFLTEVDTEFLHALRDENEKFPELVAEPLDDNFFTVNLHPRLTPHKIDWLEKRSSEENLCLSEMVVRKVDGQLGIWHNPSNKKVLPINYGFEALERRSPLFQTLVGLGPIVTDVAPLRKLLRQGFATVESFGQSWPRIYLEDGLVILRAGWEINPEHLPNLAAANRAQSWLELRKWQKEMELPNKVFVKIISPDKKRQGDHYKPQFFNFANPIFLEIWLSLMKQDMDQLFIEEVFPKARETAQEWVIEYKG